MLVTLPTPDPAPKSDTKNPAHNEPGGLCEDPIAIRLRLGARAARPARAPHPVIGNGPCASVRSRCASRSCQLGLQGGLAGGDVLGLAERAGA